MAEEGLSKAQYKEVEDKIEARFCEIVKLIEELPAKLKNQYVCWPDYNTFKVRSIIGTTVAITIAALSFVMSGVVKISELLFIVLKG